MLENAVASLGTVVRNFDSKRIPLSLMERQKRQGTFPYYGATGVMDRIDGYLFDGLYLLVAEDGSVEAPDGRPVVQLVSGKFWVNNHAHVLQGANDAETRYLYYALQTIQIRPYMSGSVQAKLSQGNLNRIPVPYPDDATVRAELAELLSLIDAKIGVARDLMSEMRRLAEALVQSGDAVAIGEFASAPRDAVNPSTLGKARVALFSIPAFDARGTAEVVEASTLQSGKLTLKAGDVCVSKLNPSISRICLVHDLDSLAMLGSTEWIVLRATDGLSPYALRAALGPMFKDQLAAMASGTTGSHQRVRPEDVLAVEVPDPRTASREKSDLFDGLLEMERNLLSEVLQLERLREGMLPALMDGRLELSPAA